MKNKDFNDFSTSFFSKIKNTNINNIVLFVLFSSIITGFLLGIIEFIERNFAINYTLSLPSKLFGIISTSSELSLYSFAIGLFFSILVSIIILTIIYTDKYSTNNKYKNYIIWSLPILIFSIFYVFIIDHLYYIGANSDFTIYFLFNKAIALMVFYKFPFAIAFLFSGFYAISKNENRSKTFLIALFTSLIVCYIAFYLLNKYIGLAESLSNLYYNSLSLYQTNPIIVLLILLAIFFVYFYVFTYISVIIIPELWKYKSFKIFATSIFFLAFCFFYLFTVNYLIGQSFYVNSIGEIHFYTGLFSLIYFFVFIMFILYFIGFKPSTIKQWNTKTCWVSLLSILVLLSLLVVYLKPQTEELKAFVDKSSIIQKHFSHKWLFPITNKKQKISYTLPDNKICTRNQIVPGYINTENKPDIFLISIDALRTDFAMNKKLAPNINNFLNNAYTFINNYSPATHTPASLSSIATSKYFAGPITALPPTLASILVESGYRTRAFIGVNLANDKLVMDRTQLNDIIYPSPIIKGYEELIIPKSSEKNNDPKMLKRAIKATAKLHQQNQLLVWLHIYQLHEIPVNEVFKNFFSNKHFINEYSKRLKNSDKIFGEFIAYLKENDLYDKSLIILFSDHGEEIKEHGSFFHTFSLYNELIRVPLAIKYPDQKGGAIIQTPVSTLDLTPTIINYLGTSPYKFNFCGESLLELTHKRSAKEHKLPISIFYRAFYHNGNAGSKIPGAILMQTNPPKYYIRELYKYSIIDKNNEWKLIYNLNPEYFELYNLIKDPQETHNLADKHKNIVNSLVKALENQLKGK